jgi:hypothetical protein
MGELAPRLLLDRIGGAATGEGSARVLKLHLVPHESCAPPASGSLAAPAPLD